jgi:hypothetical protein
MSLEALRNAQFSHKSDVFAFGVLLWEILSLGRTPWGAFGVAAFAQALEEGERLAFPPAIELSFGAVEVAFAKSIFAVALRCWKKNPAKRPHFHQLEAEFAVHHTVVTTTTAAAVKHGAASVGAGSRAQVDGSLISGRVKCEQWPTALDADGYVAPTGTMQQPSLHADRYVADTAAILPLSSTHGLVTDSGSVQLPSSTTNVSSESTSLDSDGYVMDTGSVQLPNSTTNAAPLRNGIAARSARNPSLYLGFNECPPSTVSLHAGETKL